jgi:serine/threonine-protein kinase
MATDDETVPVEGPGAKPLRDGEAISALGSERYQVIGRIGHGGMGEVLAARDQVIGREIAIKRMLAARPTRGQTERFLREARIQGTLDHPAIPPVYELAEDTLGRPYFAMKRLRGATLLDVLSRIAAGDDDAKRDFPRERLLRAFVEVCLAVEFAHVRGVIHRDLKPSNIMLGDFGEVFVLDWGVAKRVGDADDSLDQPRRQLTRPGAPVGTPTYMAPEQVEARADVDHRADVYALGCILVAIVAGKPLQLDEDIPALLADVAPELAGACVAATQHERDDRTSSAWELGRRVQGFLEGDRDLEQRRELAKTHLANARDAMERDDHRRAMRDAGRAMALDPKLAGAAELVGRLMLEPPRETPPEVEASLAEVRAQSAVQQARLGLRGYAAYALLVPYMVWIGLRSQFFLVTFSVVLVTLIGLGLSIGRTRRGADGMARKLCIIGGNAVLVALFARMFSPILLAPPIAALTAAIMTSNPMYRTRGVLPVALAMISAAILVPWALELSGVLSPTLEFLPDRMVIFTGVQDPNIFAVQLGLSLFGPALIAVTAFMMLQRVHVEDQIQRRVHLQSWRLRQLVAGEP